MGRRCLANALARADSVASGTEVPCSVRLTAGLKPCPSGSAICETASADWRRAKPAPPDRRVNRGLALPFEPTLSVPRVNRAVARFRVWREGREFGCDFIFLFPCEGNRKRRMRRYRFSTGSVQKKASSPKVVLRAVLFLRRWIVPFFALPAREQSLCTPLCEAKYLRRAIEAETQSQKLDPIPKGGKDGRAKVLERIRWWRKGPRHLPHIIFWESSLLFLLRS
jgi:hypothetical protein